MNNELILKNLQNSYESLKYFSIEANRLILHLDKDYKIPLLYTNLSSLNPNLFLLNPQDIFHIIYMLELLPKTELNQNEINYINSYTQKYLKLNDEAVENNNIDTNIVWCYSIPIYTSYDPNYNNNPCSSLIQQLLNEHTSKVESSISKQPKLVLKNPNFQLEEEYNSIESFEKAGFTTLFLIAGAVISTCIYIIYFIAH